MCSSELDESICITAVRLQFNDVVHHQQLKKQINDDPPKFNLPEKHRSKPSLYLRHTVKLPPPFRPNMPSPGECFKQQRIRDILSDPRSPAAKQLLTSTYQLNELQPSSSHLSNTSPPALIYEEQPVTSPLNETQSPSASSAPIRRQSTSPSLFPPMCGLRRNSTIHRRSSIFTASSQPDFITSSDSAFPGMTSPRSRRRSRMSLSLGMYSRRTSIRHVPSSLRVPSLDTIPSEEHQEQQSFVIKIYKTGIVNFAEYMQWVRTQKTKQQRRINAIIRASHELLIRYALPCMDLGFSQVLRLAETHISITPQITLACANNRDELSILMSEPGRQFKGTNARNIAAVVLQRAWRHVMDERKNKTLESQAFAISTISTYWATRIQRKLFARRAQLRFEAANVYHDSVIGHVAASTWKSLIHGMYPRPYSATSFASHSSSLTDISESEPSQLIIHIPSISLSQRCRNRWKGYSVLQHRFSTRILDAVAANTRVLLVPTSYWPDAYHDIYAGIISEITGISIADAQSRFDVIPPAQSSFASFSRLPLSRILTYSPVTLLALERITTASYIRRCIITSILPEEADIIVAHSLHSILMGCSTVVSRFLRSKCQLYHYFLKEKIPCPTNTIIETGTSLSSFCKSFARLIVENDTITQWTFLLDDAYDDFGALVIDISDQFTSMSYLQSQKGHYQQLWRNGSRVQQSSISRIGNEMRTVFPKLYSAIADSVKKQAGLPQEWSAFFEMLTEQGAIILAGDPLMLSIRMHYLKLTIPQDNLSLQNVERHFLIVDILIDPCRTWLALAIWQELCEYDEMTGDVGKIYVSPPSISFQSHVIQRIEQVIGMIGSTLAERHVIGHASILLSVEDTTVSVQSVSDSPSAPYVSSSWIRTARFSAADHRKSSQQITASRSSSRLLLDQNSSSLSLKSKATCTWSDGCWGILSDGFVITSNQLQLLYAAPLDIAVLYQLLKAKGYQHIEPSCGATLLPLDAKQHETLAFVAFARRFEDTVDRAVTLLGAVSEEVCPARNNDENLLTRFSKALQML